MATTIQIRPATRERLASLKSSPRETYDDLINKLLALVPRGDVEGPYSDAFRIGLLNARLDVRAGRLSAHAAIRKRMGLRSRGRSDGLTGPSETSVDWITK